MITDPISDCCTRIRNAARAFKFVVKIPFSNLKLNMVKVLYEEGYILNYKVDETYKPKNYIIIALKYYKNISTIQNIKRISKPSLKKYCKKSNLPRVINGLGIAILSTSQGVMTNKKAKQRGIGGEVLCYVH